MFIDKYNKHRGEFIMSKLEVFDPPMCCSTGICGASDDPTLVTFASDLEWLKQQGVEIVRHGITLEPVEFLKNEAVQSILNVEGNSSLPIITIDGEIVSKGCYCSRLKLAELCKVEYNEDEAPPVHREENCCCGVDCDCSPAESNVGSSCGAECDCTNAAAEDNCYCETFSPSYPKPNLSFNNSIKTIFIAILLIIIFILLIKIFF